MINSMTGYGRGEVERGGVRWTVELKSVNHRFLEISLSLPRNLWALEDRCRKAIKSRLGRGRVEVHLSWEGQGEQGVRLRLAPNLAAELQALLTELAAALPDPEPVRLAHLLHFADLIVNRERQTQDLEDLWLSVSQALAQALDSLQVMRGNEGAALGEDMLGHLGGVRQELARIESQAGRIPHLWQERLQARLGELLGESAAVDEARLAQEVAILAERRDIREELSRLTSHVNQFQEALAGPGPMGRKLDFLLQEMLRESNTLGVKAADLDIAQAVLATKAHLERLREQVQNVE